ncbi:MAG: RNA polymerase sigma factor [Planctomycetota bacterium]
MTAEDAPIMSRLSDLDWDRVIDGINVPLLIYAIERMLSGELRRRQSAEDILQDTLFEAHRASDTFEWRGIDAFRGWILITARNRVRMEAQKASAAKRAGDQGAFTPSDVSTSESRSRAFEKHLPAPSTTPSRLAGFKEEYDRVRNAIESLPQELRDVVLLRLVDCLSTAEASSRLGVSESVIKHRLREGIARVARRRGA